MALGFMVTGFLTYGYEAFTEDWKLGFVGGISVIHLRMILNFFISLKANSFIRD